MLQQLISRPDTKWVLTTFSVMGFLNLASRMAVVYKGAGLFAVAMAFVGIGGWIHGIAAVARSAQICATRKQLTTLVLLFFPLGCALAFPWHFFAFDDAPRAHPVLYFCVQSALALAYMLCRSVLPRSKQTWAIRHLILGYATFSCLFQSVSPKVDTDWLSLTANLNLTVAFAGSTLLIFVVMASDLAHSTVSEVAKRVPVKPKRS
ncbi:MAG: hypothetical protein ACPGNV_12540 [Mangrovicoccus sp.]